jgi:hypothetical protein
VDPEEHEDLRQVSWINLKAPTSFRSYVQTDQLIESTALFVCRKRSTRCWLPCSQIVDPMIANVHSQSMSFLRFSKARVLGRRGFIRCTLVESNLLVTALHDPFCASCKFPIEKKSGCDHMKCTCTHEFCYECRAPHKLIVAEGNHRYEVRDRFSSAYGTLFMSLHLRKLRMSIQAEVQLKAFFVLPMMEELREHSAIR